MSYKELLKVIQEYEIQHVTCYLPDFEQVMI